MSEVARARQDDFYDVKQQREEDDSNMPGACCPRYMRKHHPVTAYYWVEMLFLFVSVAIIGYARVCECLP